MSNLTDRLVPVVRPLVTWVQLAAVVSFANGALSIILGVAGPLDAVIELPLVAVLVVLLNVVMGVGSIVLGVVLLRYANRLAAMTATRDIEPLIEGAAHEKTYWQIAIPLTLVWMLGQFIGTAATTESGGAALIGAMVALHTIPNDQPMTATMVVLYLLGGAFAVAGVIFAWQASTD